MLIVYEVISKHSMEEKLISSCILNFSFEFKHGKVCQSVEKYLFSANSLMVHTTTQQLLFCSCTNCMNQRSSWWKVGFLICSWADLYIIRKFWIDSINFWKFDYNAHIMLRFSVPIKQTHNFSPKSMKILKKKLFEKWTKISFFFAKMKTDSLKTGGSLPSLQDV